jgi:CheY-like chemotaxis protein
MFRGSRITTRATRPAGVNTMIAPNTDAPCELDETGPAAAHGTAELDVPEDGLGLAIDPAAVPDLYLVPRRSRKRVLIADDEPRIRLAVRSCLEADGYEVTEAEDGVQALEAIAQALNDNTPDVLLLDLAMPKLDGLSTLRLLSSIYSGVRPRVVVMTAYGSVTASEAAFDLGVSAFLEKPVAPDVLRAAIARAADFWSD